MKNANKNTVKELTALLKKMEKRLSVSNHYELNTDFIDRHYLDCF